MHDWQSLAGSFEAADVPALARTLQALYDAGRARWPTVTLSPAEFVSQLALHHPAEGDRSTPFHSLAAEDLYLAYACALELPAAMAAFETHFIARVPGFVAHIDGSPWFGDEIRQQLRERLLVKHDGLRARIADYSGRGSLLGWVRVSAVRLALNHVAHPDHARRGGEQQPIEALGEETSIELRLLREQHGAALTAAIKQALTTLEPEQRSILRLYLLAGQSTEAIAKQLGINRSTAARRLVAARRDVFDRARALFRERLGLSTEELASVVEALRSGLDFSLGSMLGDPES